MARRFRFANDAKDVLNPFSFGPRNCTGKKLSGVPLARISKWRYIAAADGMIGSLAYAEMRLILTRLLWSFDLELMPECNAWDEQNVFTLVEKGELNVRLTAVKRNAGLFEE